MSFNQILMASCELLKDSTVKQACEYALSGKGKRIRPRLVYAVAQGYGIDTSVVDNLACAIEYVHTYSLIHDDLPAMDNDDLRRGRLTCHKQFDEATAILAGDALLTQAFYLAACATTDSEINADACKYLSMYSGANGMILGQVLDIEAENLDLNENLIRNIHFHKTGCLLACSLILGALGSYNKQDIPLWEKVGMKLGLAFQFQDDLLDVTSDSVTLGKSNSDLENNKQNITRLIGVDKTAMLVDKLYREVLHDIKLIDNFDATIINDIVQGLMVRKK